MSNKLFIIGVAACRLLPGGSWMVQAAESQTTGSNPTPQTPATPPAAPANGSFALGFVDLVRVGKEFDGTKNSQAELDGYQQTLRKQLDDRETARFLDEKERAEVDQLRGIAAPTDEQKKQLNDYLATSKSREAQLRALQQNPNKSDQEKADADRLSKLSAKTDEDMDAMGEKLEGQLQAKADEISKKLTDTVSVAIEAVAKEKGYVAVVDKKAMLYGGTDVTDEVLKQLNKK
jgi:Skp family chaperone for outer membrane proteins